MANEKDGNRFSDWFANLFAEMITDIRRKVVEEPWWGKPQDAPATGGEPSGPSVHMKIVNSETTYNKTTTSHEAHFSINNGRSAWDWQPDPRATAALQQIEGAKHDQDTPGDKGRGIDL